MHFNCFWFCSVIVEVTFPGAEQFTFETQTGSECKYVIFLIRLRHKLIALWAPLHRALVYRMASPFLSNRLSLSICLELRSNTFRWCQRLIYPLFSCFYRVFLSTSSVAINAKFNWFHTPNWLERNTITKTQTVGIRSTIHWLKMVRGHRKHVGSCYTFDWFINCDGVDGEQTIIVVAVVFSLGIAQCSKISDQNESFNWTNGGTMEYAVHDVLHTAKQQPPCITSSWA